MDVLDCWPFTCCLPWIISSLTECSQLRLIYIDITLVDGHLNWLNWFHFLFLVGGLLIVLIDSTILMSPFRDVIKMSMATVSFLTARLWNALPKECFPMIYYLYCFKLEIKRQFFLFVNPCRRGYSTLYGGNPN